MTTTPNIKIIDNQKFIFCLVRRKWILLTPEEKVRQFILHQLISEKSYPLKYISVEKTIKVNELSKRYDIVVFNQQLQAKVLIECKSEFIELNEKTLKQIATYNIQLKVPYLMVTNGKSTYYFEVNENTSKQISQLPDYISLQ